MGSVMEEKGVDDSEALSTLQALTGVFLCVCFAMNYEITFLTKFLSMLLAPKGFFPCGFCDAL